MLKWLIIYIFIVTLMSTFLIPIFKRILPILLCSLVLWNISLKAFDFHSTFHLRNLLDSVHIGNTIGIECNATNHSHVIFLFVNHFWNFINNIVKSYLRPVSLLNKISIFFQEFGSRMCQLQVTAPLRLCIHDLREVLDLRELWIELLQ